MLELINQLDGFDPRGNIKVLMATNRPDTLDPALMRPGRMDRKVEFGLPDLEVRGPWHELTDSYMVIKQLWLIIIGVLAVLSLVLDLLEEYYNIVKCGHPLDIASLLFYTRQVACYGLL